MLEVDHHVSHPLRPLVPLVLFLHPQRIHKHVQYLPLLLVYRKWQLQLLQILYILYLLNALIQLVQLL